MVSKEEVLEKLKKVYDPEIPVANIVDLGLIYDVNVDDENNVDIKMTLTYPGCPLATYIVKLVEESVKEIPNINSVNVKLVFDPPWTPERMAPHIKKMLGIE